MCWRAIVLTALVLAEPASAAFEVSRATAAPAPTFDPMAPAGLFWQVNPATLTWTGSSLRMGHGQPYGLAELTWTSIGLVRRGTFGSLAMNAQALGSDLYRESDVSIAFAFGVSATLSLGLTAHALDLRFGPRFSGRRFASFDVGAWQQWSGRFGVGLAVLDLSRAAVGGRPVMPTRLSIAACYRYSPQLSLRAGLATDFAEPGQIGIGETLLLAPQVHLSGELSGHPLALLLRLRVTRGRLSAELTHRDHPDLGADQILSIHIGF